MIRYDKKFNAEIASAVRRYNAKIKYYEKLGVYTLPEKTKVSEIKKDVKSRQEIRKKLRDLEKLNAKNLREVISGGEIKTLYEHKLEVQRLANVKRKVSRKLRALSSQKPTLFGKEMPFTFTQYGTDEYVRTKQMKEFLNKQNLQTMNYKQYQNLLKVIERIEVNYINPAFKNNIIDMLDSIAYYYNYSNEERNKLKQKINSLSNDEFTNTYATFNKYIISFRVRYCKFTKGLEFNTKKYKLRYKDNLFNIISAQDYKNLHKYVDVKVEVQI